MQFAVAARQTQTNQTAGTRTHQSARAPDMSEAVTRWQFSDHRLPVSRLPTLTRLATSSRQGQLTTADPESWSTPWTGGDQVYTQGSRDHSYDTKGDLQPCSPTASSRHRLQRSISHTKIPGHNYGGGTGMSSGGPASLSVLWAAIRP